MPIKLSCQQCSSTFLETKGHIKEALTKKGARTCNFCSKKCQFKAQVTQTPLKCALCSTTVYRTPGQRRDLKNVFCNSSCAAIYNNANKTHGTRISKLELWLQSQLSILYPDLQILYNDKTTINSELDIYIPSLRLAFELNGIFHYEPIYGKEKLDQIKNNDNRKFQACLENGIELCIIDTSSQDRFTEKSSHRFLLIIENIIKLKYKPC